MKAEKFDKFKICYPILENNIESFVNKVKEVCKDKNCIVELRLDYLILSGINIDDILSKIDLLKSRYSQKFIATIRSKAEGGICDLSKEEYYGFVEKLYLNSKADYIDVEYKYYDMDNVLYDKLFENRQKKIIVSSHVFDRVYSESEYIDYFKRMAGKKCDVVKFAISMPNKEELFTYMIAARKMSKLLEFEGKECIFIAMGEVGQLSRLWPEFTNTKVVFLTAYKGSNKLGQFTYEKYTKYRKLLAKIVKN